MLDVPALSGTEVIKDEYLAARAAASASAR